MITKEERMVAMSRAMDSHGYVGAVLASAIDRLHHRTTVGLSVADAAELCGLTVEAFEDLEAVDQPTNPPTRYVQLCRSLQT